MKKQYSIDDTPPADSNIFGESQVETPKDQEPEYKPEVKDTDPVLAYWTEYATADPVSAAKVNEVYAGLDESFKAEIYSQEIFPVFIKTVEIGEFEKVYPLAVKEKTLNPSLKWLQAYQLAAGKVQVPSPVTEPPAEATPPKQQDQGRNVSDKAAADRVWNDPDYFKQLEAEIFG